MLYLYQQYHYFPGFIYHLYQTLDQLSTYEHSVLVLILLGKSSG
jgi:hypothetical protein